MPNGHMMLDNMEFEQQIKHMEDRELLEFTARQAYNSCILTADNKHRICILEKRGKKTASITSGASAILGGALVTLVDFLLRRG